MHIQCCSCNTGVSETTTGCTISSAPNCGPICGIVGLLQPEKYVPGVLQPTSVGSRGKMERAVCSSSSNENESMSVAGSFIH